MSFKCPPTGPQPQESYMGIALIWTCGGAAKVAGGTRCWLLLLLFYFDHCVARLWKFRHTKWASSRVGGWGLNWIVIITCGVHYLQRTNLSVISILLAIGSSNNIGNYNSASIEAYKELLEVELYCSDHTIYWLVGWVKCGSLYALHSPN